MSESVFIDPNREAKRVTTIGLDADDTLWHNETLFRLTQERFCDLLSDKADADVLMSRLAEVETRNLRLYGYGVKGFTLSMIETAMELTHGEAPAAVVREILAAGREMLNEPVEPLPGVEAALAALSEDYRLVLITKGDLLHQEQTLAASGRRGRSCAETPCGRTSCPPLRPAPGRPTCPIR